MRTATVVQQLCKSRRTCFKFYCMFCFTCDRSLSAMLLTISSLMRNRQIEEAETANSDGAARGRQCVQRKADSLDRQTTTA